MPLHTRKAKKDGRKRTSSTVSNTAASPQAGVIDSPKNADKGPFQPAEKTNGPNSKHSLKPQAASGTSSDKSSEPANMPNVFAFLEENESSSDSSEDDEPQIQSPKPRSSPVPHGVLDSGGTVSQRLAGCSSAVASRSSSDSRQPRASAASTGNQLQLARKLTATRRPSPVRTYSPDSSAVKESPVSGKRQLEISRPESFYRASRDHTSLHRPPLPPSPPSSPEDSPHRESPVKRRHSSAPQVSSGYGFVASHLSRSAGEEKSGFSPLYRRFENLNHRILLHLQDEISQMEEDLHNLDEYEEIHRVATAEQEGIKPSPGSRRLDVQSQVYSSLHYRRMELMTALMEKTEQYNNALSAYSKVLQTLPRASENDIHSYRAWLKEHSPIATSETKFLDHDADLVSLTPRLAASAAAAPVYISVIIASGAILLPLLAFSMIAEFSGRLVVVTVVGGAAGAIAANYSAGIETLVDSKDGWRFATIYFGFMTFAAMFIP